MAGKLKLQRHLLGPARMLALRLKPAIETGIVMGGGSILAARYGHRRSTDIDLWTKAGGSTWVRPGAHREMVEKAHTLLGRHREEHEAMTTRPVPGGYQIKGVILDTDGLGRTPYTLTPLGLSGFEEEYPGREPLEGLAWEAMSDTEILYGKLKRLYAGEGEGRGVKQRDLFDMVMLAWRAPATFDKVWAAQPGEAREQIIRTLRGAPEALERQAHGRPVIDRKGCMRMLAPGLGERIGEALAGEGRKGMPTEKKALAPRGRNGRVRGG